MFPTLCSLRSKIRKHLPLKNHRSRRPTLVYKLECQMGNILRLYCRRTCRSHETTRWQSPCDWRGHWYWWQLCCNPNPHCNKSIHFNIDFSKWNLGIFESRNSLIVENNIGSPNSIVRQSNIINTPKIRGIPSQMGVIPNLTQPAIHCQNLVLFIHVNNVMYRKAKNDDNWLWRVAHGANASFVIGKQILR